MPDVLLVQGTALHLPLKDASVHCCVTSPPYFGLRRYDCGPGELGLEDTTEAYVETMVAVFREVKRVLRPDGTLWMNMGDSYTGASVVGNARPGSGRADGIVDERAQRNRNGLGSVPGLPAKNLLGMPWRLALAMQSDGWILRSDIIWDKPSCMPESVQDRPTRSHEYVFLFSKQARYFYEAEAIRETINENTLHRWHGIPQRIGPNGLDTIAHSLPTGHEASLGVNPAGRNARTVWRISSEPTPFAHFATFPTALVRRCLLAGAPTQVCAACGAPWRKEVERGDLVPDAPGYRPRGALAPDGFVKRALHPAGTTQGHPNHHYEYRTTGFSPTCTCQHASIPATVLDPFCGSGTTLLVARELGHHAVGIDLSYPYLHDIARKRLGLTQLASWEGRNGHPAPAVTYGDLPLFGGA